MLVAIDGNDVPVGYGDLEPDGHIDHLYCHPDRIGMGVGAALYSELETSAMRTGIVGLFVEASEGARRFFERHAFSVDSRHDYILNGVALHNYRMSKRLHR